MKQLIYILNSWYVIYILNSVLYVIDGVSFLLYVSTKIGQREILPSKFSSVKQNGLKTSLTHRSSSFSFATIVHKLLERLFPLFFTPTLSSVLPVLLLKGIFVLWNGSQW